MTHSFRSTLKRSAFVVALLVMSVSANGQGLTSMGLDYWVDFMPNYWGPAESLRLFIASPTPNVVDIEIYGGSQFPTHQIISMKGGTVTTVDLDDPQSAEAQNPEVPEYRAIH